MEIINIIAMFTDKKITNYSMKETSHGAADFRFTIFVKLEPEKEAKAKLTNDMVIKLADNDFTTLERLNVMWQTAQKYRDFGYYCPQFLRALDGTFPYVAYQGHNCIAYAEEYSVYQSAEQFDEKLIVGKDGYYTFFDDALLMNAKIATKHYDFTDLPSAYCLFHTFAPSDKNDEVMDNALEWYEIARKLPPEFSEQVERIWNRYLQNRMELAVYYDLLPTSIFQADLNHTNILLNEHGEFVGIYDFNLCGKDVFLNYLMREVPYVCYAPNFFKSSKTTVLDSILHALTVVKDVYSFSDLEKQAALPLWRCLKPLWWTSVQRLRDAISNNEKIQIELDNVEELQTKEIDFAVMMN